MSICMQCWLHTRNDKGLHQLIWHSINHWEGIDEHEDLWDHDEDYYDDYGGHVGGNDDNISHLELTYSLVCAEKNELGGPESD